jgi:Caspase domain
MMRSIIRISTVAVAFLGSTASGSAAVDRRVALVIGNATYKSASKLWNPLNDADAVSKALKRIGPQAIDGRDPDWQRMRGDPSPSPASCWRRTPGCSTMQATASLSCQELLTRAQIGEFSEKRIATLCGIVAKGDPACAGGDLNGTPAW